MVSLPCLPPPTAPRAKEDLMKRILVASLCAIPVALQAQDACRDILDQGIRNEINSYNQNTFDSDVRSAICASSDDVQRARMGAGLNLNIPIAEAILGIGGSYDSDRVSEIRRRT